MNIEDYSWTKQDQNKHDNDMKTLSLVVNNIINSYVSLEYVDVQFYTWDNCVGNFLCVLDEVFPDTLGSDSYIRFKHKQEMWKYLATIILGNKHIETKIEIK